VTQSAFDPISREPNYKQCAVRIERALISPQYWGMRGSQESDTKSDGMEQIPSHTRR